MTNQEAIEFLKNMIDREAIGFICPEREGDVAIWQYRVEALQMAISALKAQDVPDTNVGDMISRQAAIDAINEALKHVFVEPLGEEIVAKVPSSQPEPKKGKWIEVKHTFFHKCSECNWLNDIDSGFNFCPNCGSYNGGEEDEID